MTLQQLKQKADPILEDFWQALKKKQDAYFAKHGKYFQLLVSPTTNVVDGADSDFTVRKREDNVFIVDVDFEWATKIPFNIEVHEWVGPLARGYKACVRAIVNGSEYRRERDSNNVDSGWYKYVPTIPNGQ